MTTALDGGERSATRPDRSLLLGKTRYPLYRRLGGPQGRFGQVQKISPPTGIQSPDRSARSQSLYPATLHGPISNINPLNAELNSICYLLALLEPHHIFHISELRVKRKEYSDKTGMQWKGRSNGECVITLLFCNRQ
jgi:hypothetical protein